MPYFFWDSTLLILIPGILLALFAQSYVSSTYRKYSAVATHGGLPAHTVARRILDDAGLHGVQVEPTAGHLTDHYDPRARVLRLSEGVYGSSSISYTIYCWALPGDYWDVYYALGEELRSTFAEAGVEMTYDHLNVHIVENRS